MEHAREIADASAALRSDAAHGVVIHYHEIGLKGRNRGSFERQLVRNLERSIEGCDHSGIEVLNGRLLLHSDGPASEALTSRIARTFGVAFFAPCLIASSDVEEMTQATLALLAGRRFATFAIATRRATKDLPLTSRQINVALGASVQAATGAAVDLGSPDARVHVEVIGRRSFVYVDRRQGPGGLPVGSSGKVVSLLSGGIDSPVATMRMLKRGARAICCHFHSAPFTDRSSARKASELAGSIAERQGRTTLYLVAIGDAQQAIVVEAPPSLRVVLYRRLMMRIAGEIAVREGAKALVTGDSLGQVASQTLENIACTEDAATMPVLRPLIGVDKREIVAEAQALGTYETSILPYEDCCSLFVPRSPATRATVEACRAAEAGLDMGELVAACLAGAEVERVEAQPCSEAS